MSDDKVLLELAAKAAGIEIKINKVTPCYHGEPNFESLRRTHSLGRKADWIVWNPLTDDGDALRLAVKLDISVMQPAPEDRGNVLALWPNGQGVREPRMSDPCAATRRAIVRAAAAIGESLE